MTPVEQIKDRLNIVDVVSMYVSLTPSGKNLKGKSPFTNERTPSFYVAPDKGLYHCFSTGKGGGRACAAGEERVQVRARRCAHDGRSSRGGASPSTIASLS